MKNLRRILICLVCFWMALQLPIAQAADAEGQTGEFSWSLTDGVLTIVGEGTMPDYPDGAPWDLYRDQITKVVLTGGVTYVGAFAFKDYDNLKEVDFGNAIYELGKQSFYACDGLTELHLPQSFKVFGEESLRHCSNLKKIHSEGRFPSFRLNCLWDTKVIIYYPAARPWGLQYIQQMEEVFKGRIEFLCSDGTDPYDPNAVTTEPTTEPTIEPTTVPTEATVPETTEAATVVIPVVTAPAVTAPQQTQPPQPTLPEPEPTQTPDDDEAGGVAWIWLVIAVFFGLLAVTIPSIARPKRRKKRRPRYYDYE